VSRLDELEQFERERYGLAPREYVGYPPREDFHGDLWEWSDLARRLGASWVKAKSKDAVVVVEVVASKAVARAIRRLGSELRPNSALRVRRVRYVQDSSGEPSRVYDATERPEWM
jgi:hypothetical protein